MFPAKDNQTREGKLTGFLFFEHLKRFDDLLCIIFRLIKAFFYSHTFILYIIYYKHV